jgi:hypothetical protein
MFNSMFNLKNIVMQKRIFSMWVAVFAMLFVYSSRVSAQDVSDEYKSQLREMLTVSGSLEGARQVVPQLLALVKQQQPEISDEACRKVEETFNVKVIDRMVDLYAPIYIKYLTLDDLKQIVAFYQTPAGKKWGEATPSITLEGTKMGQQLGMELAGEIQQALQEAK